LVYDGHRFTQYFSNTIEEHPLLVYLTALPFTPTNTSIHKKFHHGGLPKVICGAVESWPPQMQLLLGHDGHIFSVALSHDGFWIASGSEDKTVRVWNASTGVETLQALRGHDDWVRSVAFSHDGSRIISASNDKTIRVWDASNGVEIPSGKPLAKAIQFIQFYILLAVTF
jgi:WD40 repeat protein